MLINPRVTCPSMLCLAIFVGIASLPLALQADTITIEPSKDNSLIEPHTKVITSNALGSLFCGRTGPLAGSTSRRCVMAFDIAGALPAGATVNSASLALRLDIFTFNPHTHTLHVVLGDWGEGTSRGLGAGSPATTNDVTWFHRFYDTQTWTGAGGDFIATVSAATEVGSDSTIDYVWTSPQMAADVQNWLDAPATSFGWIMLGNEAETLTAKGFFSREAVNAALRPRLTIAFTPKVECPADVNQSGAVDVDDLIAVILAWGPCVPCPPACVGDTNASCTVDVDDLIAVILAWGPCL